MDRRNFIRLMGIGAAAAATVTAGCSPAGSSSNENSYTATNAAAVSFSTTCDVLVVGSGIAGLSAAMAPSEAGLKVIVADKDTLLGGESYSASGVMEVYGAKLQSDSGVEKTADDAWQARKAAIALRYPDAETPAESLLQQISAQRPAWVDRMQQHYHANFMDPSEYLDTGTADSVIVPKSGIGGMDDIMNPLRDQLTSQGVEFRTDEELEAFITDETGALCGARFFSPDSQKVADVKASCIVLAAGGYTTNQKLFSENLPQLLTTGSCTHLADGQVLQLAVRLGAATLNMDLQPDLLGDVPAVDTWCLFAPVVAVSADGKRFAREDQRYSCPNACFEQKLEYWWTVFDQQMSSGMQSSSAAKVIEKYPDSYVGPCDTLDDLASAMNVPTDTLKATMEAFGKAADAGKDDDFGRTAFLKALSAPYYAIRQTPVRFRTVGGLRIDATCQVLDTAGSAIGNLYACGSCAAILSDGFLDNAASGLLAGSCVVDSLENS